MHKRLLSFKYAFNGLLRVVQTEMNMRIHLVAAILAVILGYILEFTKIEFCVLFLAIGMVWCAEILNTVIEKFLDIYHPEFDPKIGMLKDMAAAAVLVVSLVSLIIGYWLFVPKILALL